MAAVSLFWDTNMAAVMSCENTLYFIHAVCIVQYWSVLIQQQDLRSQGVTR